MGGLDVPEIDILSLILAYHHTCQEGDVYTKGSTFCDACKEQVNDMFWFRMFPLQ